jgi:retron-type reverse transcriptase
LRGKRKKPGAASFFANLEGELLALERQLRSGTYRPGRYVAFQVDGPKKRIVSAAPFRDRVVHHALCAVVEPIFEAGFVDHSFANRIGRGTHRAIEAYEGYRDRHAQSGHAGCDPIALMLGPVRGENDDEASLGFGWRNSGLT